MQQPCPLYHFPLASRYRGRCPHGRVSWNLLRWLLLGVDGAAVRSRCDEPALGCRPCCPCSRAKSPTLRTNDHNGDRSRDARCLSGLNSAVAAGWVSDVDWNATAAYRQFTTFRGDDREKSAVCRRSGNVSNARHGRPKHIGAMASRAGSRRDYRNGYTCRWALVQRNGPK